MVMYGIGITTFREREEENINLNAYKLFMKGKKKPAASQITRQLQQFCQGFLPGKIIRADPAIGVYEGGSEPSSEIIIEGGPSIFNKNSKGYKALEVLKELSHQDDILIYKIVKKGHPAIRLSNVEYKNLKDLRNAYLKWTGKDLGFLTYNYEQKTMTIIHVPEWDSLTTKQFNDLIDTLRVMIKSDKTKSIPKLFRKVSFHKFNVKNIII